VLTIAALDRANLALDIAVTPDTGEPGDEFLWTFTSRNPTGPQAGASVEVTGQILGANITTVADEGSSCTIDAGAERTTLFTCTVGALPVGATSTVGLRTTVGSVTEVLVSATTASTAPVPIDPNPDDNTRSAAIGVGDAFSNGAAEAVGSAEVLALAAGDVNGDGRVDIVAGSAAGEPVRVYLAGNPRESCACYRDFVPSPATVPSTGEARGVALADFDGNGTLDVVVATGGGQADEVFSNDGSGNFSPLATLGNSFARAVATGDFNGDGNADIVVATAAGNPVYLGDGAGNFAFDITLGNTDSTDVAVARLDGDNLDDIVFAGSDISRAWLSRPAGGFTSVTTFQLGGASSVAAGDLDNDGADDIVFGRESATNGAPSNPVYYNNGNGRFGAAARSLALSPTLDVALGDIDGDALVDIVFVNASGVHQVWLNRGTDFELAPEQIIDLGAKAIAVGEFGDVAETDPGGLDIVLGGAVGAGISIYLNDGTGNLGQGDTVAPELTLVGEATISIPASGTFEDPGANAIDNIEGDISDSVLVTGEINPAVVGSYTITYNVSDRAGNAAPAVSRTVIVEPAAGTGGGGGGALSPLLLAFLAMLLACIRRQNRRAASCGLEAVD
jgi:hypothetical protein